MKVSIRSLGVGLLLCTQLSFAQMAAPVALLEQVSKVILDKLSHNQALYKAKHEALVAMVDQELMPYVATDILAQNVVGRHYWKQSTEAQRKDFVKLFTQMVIKVYAGALTSYHDQKVKFLPLRRFDPDQKIASVRSLVIPSGSQKNILITYQMIKLDANWKVLDFSVDGVSLTNNYHSQFSSTLSHEGMSGLLSKLRKKVSSA